MRYSLEVVYRVCNDDTGETIEVGPDPDGLGLTEIRTFTDSNELGSRICIAAEALPLVIEALTRSQGTAEVVYPQLHASNRACSACRRQRDEAEEEVPRQEDG